MLISEPTEAVVITATVVRTSVRGVFLSHEDRRGVWVDSGGRLLQLDELTDVTVTLCADQTSRETELIDELRKTRRWARAEIAKARRAIRVAQTILDAAAPSVASAVVKGSGDV